MEGEVTEPLLKLNSKILGEGNFQTSLANLSNSKILEEESYYTSSKNQFNFQILGEENFQTSPKNLNDPGIPKEGFRISLVNSTPVGCEEGSNLAAQCNSI